MCTIGRDYILILECSDEKFIIGCIPENLKSKRVSTTNLYIFNAIYIRHSIQKLKDLKQLDSKSKGMLMTMMRGSLIILSALLFILLPDGGQLRANALNFSAASSKLLDDDEGQSIPVDQLAQQAICDKKNGNKLVSRVSSIIKLANYFDSSLDEQNECIVSHREALRDMKELVTTSSKNVCSNEKLSLIENFHQKYLSTLAKDVQARVDQQREDLPKALKLFSMFYISEVSKICRMNLINNLEWDVQDKLLKSEDFRLGDSMDLSTLLHGLGEQFSAMKSVNSYDDIIMLWSILDGSVLQKDNDAMKHISDEANGVNPITQEPVKLFVKSKNPSHMIELQKKCYFKFKPIYGKIILPVIRLADLGYSYTGRHLDKELVELKANKLVNKWYVITQICETVMPINFYVDPTIVNDQETVMITPDQAKELEASQPEVDLSHETRLSYEPVTNTLEGVDKLESMAMEDSSHLIASIKTNLSARELVVRRCLVRFAKSAFAAIKDKAGQLFFSRKIGPIGGAKGKAEIKEDVLSTDEFAELENIDETRLLQLEGAGRVHKKIGRNKGRLRQGDVIADKMAQEAELSHHHTKSMSEIIQGWILKAKSIAPSRLAIFAVGITTIGILLLLILLCMGSASG